MLVSVYWRFEDKSLSWTHHTEGPGTLQDILRGKTLCGIPLAVHRPHVADYPLKAGRVCLDCENHLPESSRCPSPSPGK